VDGIDRAHQAQEELLPDVRQLIGTYRDLAHDGRPAAALGAFYAYESQVPRIAEEKLAGLKAFYGADSRACEYFVLHRTADVHHAQVWRGLIDLAIEEDDAHAADALRGVRRGAKALWQALDGIDAARQQVRRR
jgi:pyrroloquinoline-quinone synthase